MSKVQVVGLRRHLDGVLDVLHDLSAVHVVDASGEEHLELSSLPIDDRAGREAQLRSQLRDLDRLLAAAQPAPSGARPGQRGLSPMASC